MRYLVFLLYAIAITNAGCYSFKGISIDPNTKTFYVNPFVNNAPNAVPTLPTTYTVLLNDKISNESQLTRNTESPHIEFKGTITEFRVTAQAPTSTNDSDGVAFNRLTIGLRVEYIDNQDPDNNWSSQFKHFNDFGTDQNLIDIQDNLISNIGDQLMEDIFNRAFTNW
ncbi:MAG: LPS assembly lipoprotein LptE [Bacteroidota bacterium]